MFIDKKKITASEDVEVAEEATELLFEAEDVAELVAEITEEPVSVDVQGDEVTFDVGEDQFTVTPDGDEEVLEAVRTKKRPVKASAKRGVKASARKARRVVRKVK